jgi:hypothetical protein
MVAEFIVKLSGKLAVFIGKNPLCIKQPPPSA